jgi:hypothetical protein
VRPVVISVFYVSSAIGFSASGSYGEIDPAFSGFMLATGAVYILLIVLSVLSLVRTNYWYCKRREGRGEEAFPHGAFCIL